MVIIVVVILLLFKPAILIDKAMEKFLRIKKNSNILNKHSEPTLTS